VNDVECLEQQEDASVPSETSTTDVEMAKTVLETALLTAQEPMSLNELRRLFADDLGVETVRRLLEEIRSAWAGRGVELVNVASGWRFRAKPEMQSFLDRLNPQKPPKYSRAVLETLAIVAYRQPVTRGDIEDIRGVAVSTNIVKVLESRGWIEAIGHREVPGRPALYATTRQFLDDLALRSVEELPPLEDLGALIESNGSADLALEPAVSAVESSLPQAIEWNEPSSPIGGEGRGDAPTVADDSGVPQPGEQDDAPTLLGDAQTSTADDAVIEPSSGQAPAAECAEAAGPGPQADERRDEQHDSLVAETASGSEAVIAEGEIAASSEGADAAPTGGEDEGRERPSILGAVDTDARD